MEIFEFVSSTDYLIAFVEAESPQKKGLKSRIARALNVSPTMMTFFLQGEKIMSLEQATELSEYLKLSDRETDYLFLLVEKDRAIGSAKLLARLNKRIQKMRDEANKIAHRVTVDKEITDEVRAIYYGSWLPTAVRNLAAIPKFNTAAAIAEQLKVPRAQIDRTIEFLQEHGLVVMRDGELHYGPKLIHVPAESPFVARHHQNWRQQAFPRMERFSSEDLYFTCPMSLSKEAVLEIRKMLPGVIERVMKIVGPSESERAYCLNIDWFEL